MGGDGKMSISRAMWDEAIDRAQDDLLDGMRPLIELAAKAEGFDAYSELARISDDMRTVRYLDSYREEDSIQGDYSELFDEAGVRPTVGALSGLLKVGAAEHARGDAYYFVSDHGDFVSRAIGYFTPSDAERAVRASEGVEGLGERVDADSRAREAAAAPAADEIGRDGSDAAL